MGFFDRLFGMVQHSAQGTPAPNTTPAAQQQAAPVQTQQATMIAPERVGLNGEYDQSGLAKRVAKAFDSDATLKDHGHLFIAQHNATVVLKGKIGSQAELNKMVEIARGVSGAQAVETNQVQIGN